MSNTTMTTHAQKCLAVSMIQMLREDIRSGKLSSDQVESLEVAIQCLETGYDVKDADYAFQPSKPLLEIFKQAENVGDTPEPSAPVDEETCARAEALKNEGNDLMRNEKFTEAVQKYTEAIKLRRAPAYFCNRAAAYSKLDQHDLCIQDCRTAISLDAKYAKAYARLGLALSNQYRYSEAVDAYRTALELEPNNSGYQNNLKIAEEKMQERTSGAQANPFANMMGGAGGVPGGGNPFDLSAMLNNPAMLQMATQMMSSPQMQQMMGNLMENLSSNPGGQGGLNNLLSVGQQLAQAMQSSNPELVEQLRQQMGNERNQRPSGGNAKDDTNPPPSGGQNS